MSSPLAAMAIVGTGVYAIFALAVDLFVTFLMLAGISALWPHIAEPFTTLLALFALGFPMPVLYLMVYPVQRAWTTHRTQHLGNKK